MVFRHSFQVPSFLHRIVLSGFPDNNMVNQSYAHNLPCLIQPFCYFQILPRRRGISARMVVGDYHACCAVQDRFPVNLPRMHNVLVKASSRYNLFFNDPVFGVQIEGNKGFAVLIFKAYSVIYILRASYENIVRLWSVIASKLFLCLYPVGCMPLRDLITLKTIF